MKKLVLMLIFIISATMSVSLYAADAKSHGMINEVNYTKLNITINGVPYKLSNTVKVYGFSGNKFLNVKKLTPQLAIGFKYSTKKTIRTISEIWARPN